MQAKISKQFRLGTAHKSAFLHLQSYSFGLLVRESGSFFLRITMAFLKETSVWEDYIESSFITLVCSIDGLVVNCGVDVEVILVAGGRRRRWRHIGAEGMCLCTRLPLCLISPCKVNAMQCKLSVCGEILKKCVVVDFQTPSQDLRQLLSFSDDHPRGHFWGQNSQRKKIVFGARGRPWDGPHELTGIRNTFTHS